KSVRIDRSKTRGPPNGNNARLRTQDPDKHQTGNLRRTRWRTGECQILSPAGLGLRQLQPVPDSDCTISSCAGSARELKAWSHFRTSKRRANELRTRFII